MANYIHLPITEEEIINLHAGDTVYISGVIYTARDAAHKRMYEAIECGDDLPINIEGQGIYYLGPAPARPGCASGAAGPTSSYRMDKYTPMLLDRGLKVIIGKGKRSQPVIDSIVKNCAVYFAATGGAAALLAKSIISSEVVAYDDLDTEAIRRLELYNFPAIVAVDCYGVNQYIEGPKAFLKM